MSGVKASGRLFILDWDRENKAKKGGKKEKPNPQKTPNPSPSALPAPSAQTPIVDGFFGSAGERRNQSGCGGGAQSFPPPPPPIYFLNLRNRDKSNIFPGVGQRLQHRSTHRRSPLPNSDRGIVGGGGVRPAAGVLPEGNPKSSCPVKLRPYYSCGGFFVGYFFSWLYLAATGSGFLTA